MLSRLSIRDIVLIEKLDIDFLPGLSVLTGETGAGTLGSDVSVYLDGGPCPEGVPSTIVDCTGATFRAVRVGAVSLDLLREVVPDLAA